MVMYIPTEKETNLVTSSVWGNGTVTSREVRNGTVILKADFPDGWRELDYGYYHRKGIISYAIAEDNTRKNKRQRECVEYLKSRKVKYLVHFTPVENLKFIFDEGICPRTEQQHAAVWTDEWRLDGHTDCSCFSISYPNYSMLYQKRKNQGMNRFAILLVDCDALLELSNDSVAYFPTNAAEARNRHESFEDHTGIEALQEMFADGVISKNTLIKRSAQGLTSEYTTNPQAEMLIRGIVPAKYIRGMVICDWSTENCIPSNASERTDIICDTDMFWPQDKWADYESRRRAG